MAHPVNEIDHLFISQGFDGIEPRGLPGGIEAEDDAHGSRYGDGDADDQDRGLRRPMHVVADQDRSHPPQENADPAAHQAEHDGLHEELAEDVVAAAPTAIRRPISRVRSVTETSMMFMMPTPPTISEMAAAISSMMPIKVVVEEKILVISVMSRMLKSSWESSSSLAALIWCRSRRRPLISRMHSGICSVDAALTRRLLTVTRRLDCGVSACLDVRDRRIKGGGVGINVAEAVDPAGRGLALRRVGIRHGVERHGADAELDRRPGGHDDVVLVAAHHVGALGRQDADDAKSDVGNPQSCHGRLVVEKLPLDRGADHADLIGIQHVAVGEDFALLHFGPVADVEVVGRGADDRLGLPVVLAVDQLGGRLHDGGEVVDRRALPDQLFAVFRREGGPASAPKLTPPLIAAPGKTRTLLTPMLAIDFWTAAFEPSPISVMAITAPTPMITPRAVSAERILFRRKAPRAVRHVGGMSEGMPKD